MRRIALDRRRMRPPPAERAREHRGRRRARRREVRVAARHRQPVGLAHQRAADHLDRQIQVDVMRRTTASCCASFRPKYARHGPTIENSFATTVVTPSKWPGRLAPHRRSVRPATCTVVRGALGVHLVHRSARTGGRRLRPRRRPHRPRRRADTPRSSSGPNWVGFTKSETTTRSHSGARGAHERAVPGMEAAHRRHEPDRAAARRACRVARGADVGDALDDRSCEAHPSRDRSRTARIVAPASRAAASASRGTPAARRRRPRRGGGARSRHRRGRPGPVSALRPDRSRTRCRPWRARVARTRRAVHRAARRSARPDRAARRDGSRRRSRPRGTARGRRRRPERQHAELLGERARPPAGRRRRPRAGKPRAHRSRRRAASAAGGGRRARRRDGAARAERARRDRARRQVDDERARLEARGDARAASARGVRRRDARRGGHRATCRAVDRRCRRGRAAAATTRRVGRTPGDARHSPAARRRSASPIAVPARPGPTMARVRASAARVGHGHFRIQPTRVPVAGQTWTIKRRSVRADAPASGRVAASTLRARARCPRAGRGRTPAPGHAGAAPPDRVRRPPRRRRAARRHRASADPTARGAHGALPVRAAAHVSSSVAGDSAVSTATTAFR